MSSDDRTIAEAATPGPWQTHHHPEQEGCWAIWDTAPKLVAAVDYEVWGEGAGRAIATFIAHFNPAKIIEMLDERDALREVVEAAQFASDYFKAHGDSYSEAAWLIDIRSALAALDAKGEK